jgi:hypothetical protein
MLICDFYCDKKYFMPVLHTHTHTQPPTPPLLKKKINFSHIFIDLPYLISITNSLP